MSANGISQDYLNGQSAAILVVFVLVSYFVIWPIKIPLLAFVQRNLLLCLRVTRVVDSETSDALSKRRLYFPLSLETAPVIGVLLLLATTTIDGSTIRLGVKGDENVKPYDVLVLFISLAYIAIALDGTGALEAVAFWVSKRGGSSGPRLFAYLYTFFLFTGCIVGNDPLILSGTPFLAYLTKYTNLEPTPWIFSEFMAANTASAVLVSSNPTNILITGSFNLNYLTDFTKWTVLPSIIPGILNYFILYFMFRDRIPTTLVPLKDDPWSKLRDPRGAVFLSVLMLVTIAVLVGTSFVPGHAVEVWMVTAPAGVLALTFEIVNDRINPKEQQIVTKQTELDPAVEMFALPPKTSSAEDPIQPHQQAISNVEKEDKSTAVIRRRLSDYSSSPNKTLNTEPQPLSASQNSLATSPLPQSTHLQPPKQPSTLLSHLQTLRTHFPRTTRTLSLLPIPLLPFAICQFILVRGLSQRGWITTFAHGFSRATPTPIASVFFFSFVSAAFLCPFAGTNIGATILLVEILRSPAFLNSDAVLRDQRVLQGAIYAVAMGSNLGAFSYVFAASLAGLLWVKLLRDKGVVVGKWKFCLVNLGPLVVQTTVAAAVLVGQVYWFL